MKISRVPAAAALATGSVILLAGPAFAHVSVQPGQAEKGGYATISFKVPNESDKASTTKLEVSFPTDQPLASVMAQDVPGWKVEITKAKLAKPLTLHGKQITEAVSKVTWTGGKIEPGKFQQFPLSVGRLPEDADRMVFKAVQTYDDNQVVRWIEEPKDGAAEPQNPAPVLKLTAATGGDHHGGSPAEDPAKNEAAKDDHHEDEQASASSGSDTTARTLGIAGIVIGAAGVAFGASARRRSS
ncbi:YcnI family protein [Streptomyces bambusae]|uniref:YcnI family copper-binding membrane protein n=1 Tax=Streptomyces bambusae TaxID=1550616 RepID=UPI001CFCC1AF|nr:YcnI family protein [Streptomyces bambusae]MCB5163248.1 YcnI family protein [Streptomyces bambusae]